jgi:putative ABC transport system substrate-binding protein
VEGQNIKYDVQNAQGEIATLTSIAQRFRDQKVDLVLTITTPALQAALKTFDGSSTPIVFAAVVDPFASTRGIIKSPTEKPANVTGVYAGPPVKDALALGKKLLPNAKRVGMLWSPREPAAEQAAKLARDAAKGLDLELVEGPVNAGDEVLPSAQTLAGKKVDFFFVSYDTTVQTAIESVIKVAVQNKIPLITTDTQTVQRGAAVGVGFDNFAPGVASGRMAGRILKGASPKEIAIEKLEVAEIAINTKAAEQQGLTVPADVLQQAKYKYDAIKTPT